MKKNFILCFLSVCMLFSKSFAQHVVKGELGMYPEQIVFTTNAQAYKSGSVLVADDKDKISTNNNTRLIHSEKDNMGFVHYRYQQTFAGIPVENAVYIIHVNKGIIISENGKWVRDFPDGLETKAVINKSNALNKALSFVGAKIYKWQLPSEEAFLKREQNNRAATFYPKAELVLYSGEENVVPSALRLAYKFDIYAHNPTSRQIVFVDASNGKILGKRELIHTTNATGSAATAYSGTQSITTNNTGTTYQLRETGRGNGIQTFNMKTAGTNYGAAVDFTDADNIWNNVNTNKDQYATDAHWGAEETYDYYFTRYNRSSVDNAGLALKSYVHVSLIAQGYSNNINAFWDGSRMSYGDGGVSGSTTYNPLTALDIAGHEISHGVTQYSSNLTYSGESGAMNEGFSDIFGTSIEFYARPTRANWLIGEDIGAAFRSMSNPNQYSQPDTYHGTYWSTGTADNGGVHTNSGVLNFWYYLLSQGGSGTNDNGLAYSVSGIGIDKAGAIAYRTNTTYLTATSNYANARTYAIQSAEDIYGVGSNEATQVSCAWAAVGIGTCGTTPACATPTGLSSSAITNSSATVSWTAVSGAVSYSVDYKLNTSSTWVSAATAATATSVNLTGLTAASLYDWRVKTNCSSSSGAYSQAQFTTTGGTGCSTAFEPNESQSAAATITSGITNSAAISSATDIDYYKIVTTSTSNNVYNLAGPSGVDYDLYIYNSGGTQVGSGTSSTATETATLNNQAAGTYYIKVIGYNGANSVTCYTIKATASPVTSCQSAYDVSTNGTTSGAATIPFNTNITGLVSPSGDVDNYKFVITNAGSITITLGTLPGDYDLKLLNSAGTQVGISQNGNTTGETINYTASPGTYFAQVYGYNGTNNATTCYTLKAQLGTASFAPVPVMVKTAFLKVYPNPATDVLNVSVLGEIYAKSSLQVVDARGQVIIEQKVSGNIQQLHIANLSNGIYILKVMDGTNNISFKFVKQ